MAVINFSHYLGAPSLSLVRNECYDAIRYESLTWTDCGRLNLAKIFLKKTKTNKRQCPLNSTTYSRGVKYGTSVVNSPFLTSSTLHIGNNAKHSHSCVTTLAIEVLFDRLNDF